MGKYKVKMKGTNEESRKRREKWWEMHPSFQILPNLRLATPVPATQKNETFKELIINYSAANCWTHGQEMEGGKKQLRGRKMKGTEAKEVKQRCK